MIVLKLRNNHSIVADVTLIERIRHWLHRFQEFSGNLHFGQKHERNIWYSINSQVHFAKFGIVGCSMNAEPWALLFTDFFFLRKKKGEICFNWGDCHFIVCSVSSMCILISTSNNYCNFRFLNICHYFRIVRTSSAASLPFYYFIFKTYVFILKCSVIFVCKCLNKAYYNTDIFLL